MNLYLKLRPRAPPRRVIVLAHCQGETTSYARGVMFALDIGFTAIQTLAGTDSEGGEPEEFWVRVPSSKFVFGYPSQPKAAVTATHSTLEDVVALVCALPAAKWLSLRLSTVPVTAIKEFTQNYTFCRFGSCRSLALRSVDS